MKITKNNNKTGLVFPKQLLKTIDEFVGKRKRGKFVVEAAKEKLARERFSRALKEAAGSWKKENHPELHTEKDIDKYIRSLRKSWHKRLKRIYG